MGIFKNCKWCGKKVFEGDGERNYCNADHNIKSVEFGISQLERDYKEDHNDWMKEMCTG